MVPIGRDISHDSHDAARLYCNRLAQRLEATAPARYTTSSAPAKRNKRIYIDYLRNGRGTTAIGAYSPRAREGFPVAAPVTWAQVERGIRPDAFTIARPPPSGAAAQGSVKEESTGRLNCFQKVGPLARVSLPGPGKLLCAAEPGR